MCLEIRLGTMEVVLGHEGQPGDGRFHRPVPHHNMVGRPGIAGLRHY